MVAVIQDQFEAILALRRRNEAVRLYSFGSELRDDLRPGHGEELVASAAEDAGGDWQSQHLGRRASGNPGATALRAVMVS
jgi:hypothetical protein